MRRLRIAVIETLILLWLSRVNGSHSGHVRAISKRKGTRGGGTIGRGLTNTRIKGKKKPSKVDQGKGGTDETENGTVIVIFPVDNGAMRRDDLSELEEPTRAYSEKTKLKETSRSKRSKLSKKSKSGSKKRSDRKIEEKNSGSSLEAPSEVSSEDHAGSRIDSEDGMEAFGFAPESSWDESSIDMPETSGDEGQTVPPTMEEIETTKAPSEPPISMPLFPPESVSVEEPSTAAPTDPPTASPSDAPTALQTDAPTTAPTVEPTSNEPSTSSPTQRPATVKTEEEASASFEFESDLVREPTAAEIFRLEISTSAFYIGVFAEAYRDNPDTIFNNIIATVEELTYSADANPPIQIEWSFEVSYAATSEVIPSSEENLELIYGDEETLNSYVDIYLTSGSDVWSSVTKVSYEESPAEGSSQSTTTPEEPSPFPSTSVEASLLLEFNSTGTLIEEPSQEAYGRLTNALGAFYTALLTEEYSDVADAALATVGASLNEAFLDDQDVLVSLQANIDFEVFFSEDTTNVPPSESILSIMQENTDSLLRFLMDYIAWEDDDAWSEITDVSIQPL